MQQIDDARENCNHPWQVKGNDIALKVVRENTDKLKKIVKSNEDEFQGLRQMAIDCEVWATIFGDQGANEGSKVYALAGDIHRCVSTTCSAALYACAHEDISLFFYEQNYRETAGEIIRYLTVELMSPPGKTTGDKDKGLFSRPQTK
jgi:hypothetical protein